mmetsp:Transcript_4426/g.16386  ORF Transcript_4426/g.16386 Transcript_4426/m.16386 type:complete len:235 (+) Transcript_4426:2119-2823(+)
MKDDVMGFIFTECCGTSTKEIRSRFKYGPPLRRVQNKPNLSFPAILKSDTNTRSGTGTANLLPPTFALSVMFMFLVSSTRSHSKIVSPSLPFQHRLLIILGGESPSLNVEISSISRYAGLTFANTLVKILVKRRLSQNSSHPSQNDFSTSLHQSAVSEPSLCSLANPLRPWNFVSSSFFTLRSKSLLCRESHVMTCRQHRYDTKHAASRFWKKWSNASGASDAHKTCGPSRAPK